jgi:hypothetical protein
MQNFRSKCLFHIFILEHLNICSYTSVIFALQPIFNYDEQTVFGLVDLIAYCNVFLTEY